MATAQSLAWREARIPIGESVPDGLEALIVYPAAPGKYPLLLLNHGSPRAAADRPGMTAAGMWPEARELARRGWAVALVLRRGYGSSGDDWAETFGTCDNPDYLAAGEEAAADLRAAVAYLATLPMVDATRVVSVGVSAGGFATVALAAHPPSGLVAAISFAGGRGSTAADKVCHPERLVAAFSAFGETARVPTLWVYAANDHFFGPALAKRLFAAFTAAGGAATFVAAAPFGDEGHTLFSPAGAPIWTALIDGFFAAHGLLLRETPLPDDVPDLDPPGSLNSAGRRAFHDYLVAGPHKAFAVSRRGAYGWRSARRTTDEARAEALATCGEGCRVVAVDDGPGLQSPR